MGIENWNECERQTIFTTSEENLNPELVLKIKIKILTILIYKIFNICNMTDNFLFALYLVCKIIELSL